MPRRAIEFWFFMSHYSKISNHFCIESQFKLNEFSFSSLVVLCIKIQHHYCLLLKFFLSVKAWLQINLFQPKDFFIQMIISMHGGFSLHLLYCCLMNENWLLLWKMWLLLWNERLFCYNKDSAHYLVEVIHRIQIWRAKTLGLKILCKYFKHNLWSYIDSRVLNKNSI